MAGLTGLFKRGGSFYLRIVLPNHHPLKGKYANGNFVQTLGACSHREAVRRGTIKRAEVLAGLQIETHTRQAAETPIARQERPTLPHASMSLRKVYSRWKASKTRSADAESACLRALVLCEECLGPVDVVQLTRAQGDTFRAWLLTKGATSKTSRDRFTWVKTLLKYAAQDLEAIPKNPWTGLDIEHRTTARRRPWKPDELTTLFGQPLFTRYELPSEWRAGGAAAYWVPLIGLFTGARISELAQLRTGDVSTKGPVPLLSITDAGEGQKVKSSASVRSIPVHPELVRLGFLEYAEEMQKTGDGSLWPSLKLRRGRPGGFISDWFGDFRKAAGIAEKYPDFHCFRHTVRTLLSRGGVDHKVQDHITGHEAVGSTGTKVYQHVDEAELLHAVRCLKYPELVLPRAYVRPVRRP